jgi:ubiquinone/menaquinone biosynthesis C-methylase UbiE
VKDTSEKYDRFSRIYDLMELPVERKLFAGLRTQALTYSRGRVLEVGIGTGKNIPYYLPNVEEVVEIDFSSGMLLRARERAAQSSVKVTLMQMDVERLAFDDESFDTVVSAFVFCTVPHPLEGLREVYRVLKGDGRAVFLEHMKTESALVNVPLYMMNVVSRTFTGTSMVRETQKNIETAGFHLREVQRYVHGIVRLMIAGKHS